MQLGVGCPLQRLCSALAFAGLWATVRGRNRPDINYNTDESRALGACCILSIAEPDDSDVKDGMHYVCAKSSATMLNAGTYKAMLIGYDTTRKEWASFSEEISDEEKIISIPDPGTLASIDFSVYLMKKGWYVMCIYPIDKPQLRLFSSPYHFDVSYKSDAKGLQAPPAPQADIKKYEKYIRGAWIMMLICLIPFTFILCLFVYCMSNKKRQSAARTANAHSLV
ncbi:hypothetical protein PAPHI01_0138 [Pancytospora philotis]|nr:hypothetical protein PAPHI01_0138 [Pancytospora philotis]